MNKIDLSAVDLNLLVVLRILLEEGSVTRAASRLGRTQSAVSHALGRLRELFDDPLLVRVGTGMHPTPRAEALQAPLSALLRGAEALVFTREAFEPLEARRRVRLFASDYMQMVLLLPLLAQLRTLAPGIDVKVAGPRPDYLDALVAGIADVALVVGGAPSNLHYARLTEDRFVCVAGRARVGRRLDLETFASLPHILVAPLGKRDGGIVDTALREHGYQRRTAVVLPDFTTALRLVAESELILTLPERFVEASMRNDQSPPVRRFAPPIALPSLELGLAWHERVAHEPGITWFRERVVEVGKNLPRLRGRRSSKT